MWVYKRFLIIICCKILRPARKAYKNIYMYCCWMEKDKCKYLLVPAALIFPTIRPFCLTPTIWQTAQFALRSRVCIVYKAN